MTHACAFFVRRADPFELRFAVIDECFRLHDKRFVEFSFKREVFESRIENKTRRLFKEVVVRRPFRIRQKERVFRTCHRNIRDPPFLFHIVERERFTRREHAFVQTADKHIRELHALCRVDRHEFDIASIFFSVQIGKERYVRKKVFQIRVVVLARFFHRATEFGDIVESVLIVLQTQVRFVARPVHNRLQQRTERKGGIRCAKRFYRFDVCARSGTCKKRRIDIFFKFVVERRTVLFGKSPQRIYFRFADFSRRHINRAQKRDVVTGRDHAKVAHDIFDFPAAVNFYTAVKFIGYAFIDKRFFDRAGKIVRTI